MASTQHEPTETSLRLLLTVPFVLLAGASLVLGVAAFLASGAAEEVRYGDNVPVYAGMLAAAPAAVFGAVAGTSIWTRTFQPFQVRPARLLGGLAAIGLAIAMLLAYALIVGDPEHYKGNFNNVTQQWDPRVPTSGSYLALIAGVATTFPMGALGVIAKLLYLDAIEPAKLDRPQGIDPIGTIMRGRS